LAKLLDVLLSNKRVGKYYHKTNLSEKPSPLRRVDYVDTFKRQLQTVLFAQAF